MIDQPQINLSESARAEINQQLQVLDRQIMELETRFQTLKRQLTAAKTNRRALAAMVGAPPPAAPSGPVEGLKEWILETVKHAQAITLDDLVAAAVDAGHDFGTRSPRHVVSATVNGLSKSHPIQRDGDVVEWR